MKNKKEIQENFNKKYFNKEANYKSIIAKIKKEESTNINKISKIAAAVLITLIGTVGIVLATTQIYNTYVKKDDDIDLRGLFEVGNGWYSDEIRAGMKLDNESNMYYKIISNEEEYKQVKEKVKDLQEGTKIDFSKNFLILITHGEVSVDNLEKDLTVSEINADETTTYVTLVQKENPNYDKLRTEISVVVDRLLLRDNVKIKKDFSNYKIEGITPIGELPEDYSEEQAIKDGCVVIKYIDEGFNSNGISIGHSEVISENGYLLNEIVNKAQQGIESHVRVYYTGYNVEEKYILIIDIQYKNGMAISEHGRAGRKTKIVINKDITQLIGRLVSTDKLYLD